MKKASAKWKMVLAMGIFGTIAPFVRAISVSSGELALYRALMASLLLGGYFVCSKESIPFRQIRSELGLLLVSGAFMGINWILLFQAYRYTTVSSATLSYYFAPVLVMVLSPVLFREPLTKKQVLCFVMSTLGLVLITVGGGSGGENSLVGILYGLCAALFYAAVMLMNKALRKTRGLVRTLFQFLGALIPLLPYVLLTDGISLRTLDVKGWACLLVVGLVHTGLTYCLYFSSLKELSGQEAALLSYVDPLVALVISLTVLGEGMNLWQVLGGILILGFTLLNETNLLSLKRK